MMKLAKWLAGTGLGLLAGTSAQGQGTLEDHLARAKSAAGSRWTEAANYFCGESSTPNRPTDPAIEPTRLFDNLSVVGSVGTAIYIVETSEGLILIDAGYPEQIESVLLPGLKALRFDPAKVRYIIVLHGHSDHFGARIAADNHVDVELQKHPLMDGFAGRLEQLKKRGAQDPHPFVIKESDYAAFLTVISECSQAQLIRKGN